MAPIVKKNKTADEPSPKRNGASWTRHGIKRNVNIEPDAGRRSDSIRSIPSGWID
jgi:hypothetical protein